MTGEVLRFPDEPRSLRHDWHDEPATVLILPVLRVDLPKAEKQPRPTRDICDDENSC